MVTSTLWEGQPRYLSLLLGSNYLLCFRVAFLFSIEILFNFFFLLLLFDGVSFQYSQVFVRFLFYERFNFSWIGTSIPSVMCRFLLFIISMAHILMLNSIRISWLYILTMCIRVSNPFSFFINSLVSSMYIRRQIFSYDWLSLCLALYFLSMWLGGIIAIANSNGDSAPPWIFVSAKFFSFWCHFHCWGFYDFLDKIYNFVWYFVHFEAVYYPTLRDHIICIFVVNPGHS